MPLLCQLQKQRSWEDAGETSRKLVAGGSHPRLLGPKACVLLSITQRASWPLTCSRGSSQAAREPPGDAFTDSAGPPRTSSIANPGHGVRAKAFFLSTPHVVQSCSRVENG